MASWTNTTPFKKQELEAKYLHKVSIMTKCSLQILVGPYQTVQAFGQALINVTWLLVLIFTTDIIILIAPNGYHQDMYIHQAHPMILGATSAASKEDSPTWWQAMNGPYAEEYWKAAQVKISTLESKQLWTVVEQTDKMNVLPSTSAFKLKRYPNIFIEKFKDCSCAHGDKQIQGIDFLETYSLVVQWTTI